MVRWAFTRIPLERRLQTAAVVTTLLLLPIFFFFLLALVLWPPLVSLGGRHFLLGYLAWLILWDRQTPTHGGRPVQWIRNFVLFRWVAAYFPARLQIDETVKYNTGKPSIYCE